MSDPIERPCLTPGMVYETRFDWDRARGMVITLAIKPPHWVRTRLFDVYNSPTQRYLRDSIRDAIHDAIEPALASMVYYASERPAIPEAAATITELLARIAAMEKGLEPFAKLAEHFTEAWTDDETAAEATMWPTKFTFAQFRLARDLLTTPNAGGGKTE